VRFETHESDVEAAIERLGQAPLPPYIHTPLADASRYQTVYASGDVESAAAPTAGLHFTPEVIAALRRRGVGWSSVRLEVGLGTFAPIRSETLRAHAMHEERYSLSEQAASDIARARARGGRVIAVGTTVVRVLESCADAAGALRAGSGSTHLFITPGQRFQVVDGLVTNFHQPRSTPLVLVAAFIGMQRWPAAYAHALAHDYRFLSFGDAMLCWAPSE
jgi:S-adenosylmethionine:tRNA ribosyltransferase-isomerase